MRTIDVPQDCVVVLFTQDALVGFIEMLNRNNVRDYEGNPIQFEIAEYGHSNIATFKMVKTNVCEACE